MKLIVLLLCLICERYLEVGNVLKRFHWIERYITGMQNIFKQYKGHNAWVWLAILILPILMIVGVICAITRHWLFGTVELLLNFIILLYCLGPDDLYHQLKLYFLGKENNDQAQATQHYTEITGSSPQADSVLATRQLTESIFIQANERFFGVIIWYLILGPLAALLYRLATVFRLKAQQGIYPCDLFLNQISQLQNILDWIPARISSLLYLLVGNFHAGFILWRERVVAGLDQNQELLGVTGVAALNISPESSGKLAENKQAAELVDRSLMVSLVIIGLFTIISWL